MRHRLVRIRTRVVRISLPLIAAICLSAPAHGDTLHVFAAASLTDAFTEVGKAFEAEHPGVNVEYNFAGSQVLRTQIEQGAKADVFASADRVQGDVLEAKELLQASRVFTRNSLVVVTPREDSRVKNLADLARPHRKIVIASPTVPAGRYTAQVLRKMTSSGLFGDDYQNRVQANVVSQEPNVRSVLAKVVLGEADAGFVYRTDAQPAQVRVLTIPDQLNVIAEYPIGVVAGSPSPDLAAAFTAFVEGSVGQSILRKYGFTK